MAPKASAYIRIVLRSSVLGLEVIQTSVASMNNIWKSVCMMPSREEVWVPALSSYASYAEVRLINVMLIDLGLLPDGMRSSRIRKRLVLATVPT